MGIILCCAMLCLNAQSYPTLCDLMDCNPPAFSVPGNLQARILEWVAMPSSRGSKPRFPTLQVDSLPAELPGKLHCGRQLNFFPQGLLKTLCIAAFLAGQLHTNLVIFSLYNSFVSFFFGHTCNLQDLRSPSRAQTQAHSGESTES